MVTESRIPELLGGAEDRMPLRYPTF